MIALSQNQIYRFETVEVDLSRNCLRRRDEEIHLRQKSFQVLVYLLQQRARLVSKEELMEAVWKETAVTDGALVQSIKEIRRALGDSSSSPKFIKTVPKAGYRFIIPVKESFGDATAFVETEEITCVEFEYEESESATAFDESQSQIRNSKFQIGTGGFDRKRIFIAAFLVLVLLSVAAFYFIITHSGQSNAAVVLPQTPGKKLVAVMYFENQSGGADLDWLREGLADMLIANLSRSGKLTILSREQLHQILERNGGAGQEKFKFDKTLEIARKAQAAYIVTGSFARIGEKVRLNVQLYDVSDGSLETAESLTVENPEKILTEIDLLSMKLANHMGLAVGENETVLAEAMTDNLEAYRYYSLGVEKSQALHSKEAIELLEKAVMLDPNFAMAHARIGYTYSISWGLGEEGKPHLERAFALSARLSEKDRLSIAAWYAIANFDFAAAINQFREIIVRFPTETESYARLGRLLEGEGQIEEAVSVYKQGLSIDPEAKNLYNLLGGIYSRLDRHAEAIAMGNRYVALAPQEANAYDSLGLFYQHAGDYPAAIENYNRALRLNPNFEIALVHLGNSYVQTGRYVAAEKIYKNYIQIAPSEHERARGYSLLAQIYLRKNDLAAAEKAAQQSFQYNNNYFWELYLIARRHEDAARAAKYEQIALNQTVFNNRGARLNRRLELYMRGTIALENNRPDEALDNFKEALRYLPHSWDIKDLEDSLANAYLKTGRYDEAVAEYERILCFNPNYPLAHFHLAQAFEGANQPKAARANYERFLQIWKDADVDVPEIIRTKKLLGNS